MRLRFGVEEDLCLFWRLDVSKLTLSQSYQPMIALLTHDLFFVFVFLFISRVKTFI